MREECLYSLKSVRGLSPTVAVASDECFYAKGASIGSVTCDWSDSLEIVLSSRNCCSCRIAAWNDEFPSSLTLVDRFKRSQMCTFPYGRVASILNTNNTCCTETSDINNNYNDENDNTNDNNHNDNNRNNSSGGSSSSDGDNSRNGRDEEEDEAHMNNNSNNEEGNNNNGDGNDEKENKSTIEEDDAEDEEEDENSEDEENSMMNGNSKNPIEDESVQRYLLDKLSFEDVEKTDAKLSIISNTPYDSIEAQCKHNISPVKTDHFVELINVKSNNSLSDEFSGTESMEYIQYDDHGKLVTDNENWFSNLITIHPQQISNDLETKSNSLNSTSSQLPDSSEVHVITGHDTLSAVICLEEGLADDDSWVEELDHDDFPEESSDGEEITYIERVDDRYYNRNDIDLTLHTIFEESGEDSESEPEKVDSTDLEKYFVFEIGGTHSIPQGVDSVSESISESSSTISEGLDSVKPENSMSEVNSVDLAPSRLEKYFLSGFMGFSKRDSDGSVGLPASNCASSPVHSRSFHQGTRVTPVQGYLHGKGFDAHR
jgi:synaptotagmin-like protein